MLRKVLLIEDNELTCKALVHTINWKALGCQLIDVADNGIEGLRLIQRHCPALVISDIKLPGKSGIELAEQAMQMVLPPRFIFVTGHQQFEYAHAAIRLGVCDFILKPVKNEELEQAVRKQIGQLNAAEPDRDLLENLIQHAPPPQVMQMIDYLLRHYAEAVSMEVLGDTFQLNPSYIGTLMKKHTGKTFVEILTYIRIEHAKRLLRNPMFRMSEIAEQTGFNDYAYFYQVFSRVTDVSPGEYRKRLSAEEEESNVGAV